VLSEVHTANTKMQCFPSKQTMLNDPMKVRLYSGRQAIVHRLPELLALGRCSMQPGAAEYVDYFLCQPYTGGKIPHLLMFDTPLPHCEPGDETGKLTGAVIVHEYRRLRTSLGVFVTEDYGGERNVIAPCAMRSRLAVAAAEYLLRSHAHLVLISLRDAEFRGAAAGEPIRDAPSGSWLRAASTRTVLRRLLLAGDYDATLANLGAHTRRNLRVYRRRAEATFGCRFVPTAKLSEPEFLELSRVCSYPTPESVSSWRYRTVCLLPGGVLCGVRTDDGRWLSLLGGRRAGGTLFIDWQLNRVEFESLSLSTVMRSYLIEHECREGTQALLFEGGTPHSLVRSFAPDRVTESAGGALYAAGLGTATMDWEVPAADPPPGSCLGGPGFGMANLVMLRSTQCLQNDLQPCAAADPRSSSQDSPYFLNPAVFLSTYVLKASWCMLMNDTDSAAEKPATASL